MLLVPVLARQTMRVGSHNRYVERVTSRELGRQLREVVSLLCAPAGQQADYIASSAPFALPPDDLLMQLDMTVPAWLPRLLDGRVIDAGVAEHLAALRDYILDVPKSAWRDDPQVFAEAEWQLIRRHAATVLEALDASLRRYDAAAQPRTS